MSSSSNAGAPALTANVADAAPAASDRRNEGAGLKKKMIKGGLWTGFGFTFDQGLSVISNLALIYFSVGREDFGIMALIISINIGLEMFSDVGITASLIQNKRQDPAFYNTAWTMQLVRGFVLWGVACALAWPLSQVTTDWAPLATLLPIASLTTVFNGLRSSGWATANRRLDVRIISIISVITSVVRVGVMLGVAWYRPDAWALVAGLVTGSVVTCILSHLMIRDVKNRLHFEREAFMSMIRYGKWLFLATLVTFWAGQIDKFLLSGLVSTSALGLYWVGMRFADLGPMFFKKVGQVVGFPGLSDLFRRDEERFKERLLYMRQRLTVPICCLLVFMILMGPILTWLMYRHAPDVSYIEAGWIIQVLCFNSIAGMVTTSYGHAFMASGRTKMNLLSVLAQLIAMVTATLTGYHFGGETGFLLGIGVSQWVKYIADAGMAKMCGFWHWKFDLAVMVGFSVLAYLAIIGSDWLAWRFVI